MNYYQQLIKESTNCRDNEVNKIEDFMRNIIFHSTLDHLSRKEFIKGAKEAYEFVLYMESDEGKEYMKSIATNK